MFKKILDLNEIETVQVAQATSWSFYFEGERYFEGTRSFATASGIEKPLLNAYRLMDLMGTTRVTATSDAAYPVSALDDDLGKCQPEEVDVLASRRYDGALTIAVWRHADDQYHADDRPAEVSLELQGMTAGARLQMTAHRIDHEHSNSHTEWVRQGSPQDPTPAQITAIKARQGLETSGDPLDIVVGDDGVGHVTVQLGLPSAVLLVIEEAS
jgi:xylan 1,4-beta-xylosidase